MVVDLDAVAANVAEVRRRAGAARKVIAVLKADAYGHGSVAVAMRLQQTGVAYLAVGDLDDAIALRRAGIDLPIFLLGHLHDRAAEMTAFAIMPSIAGQADVLALAHASVNPKAVFVKVDCGFGRFGVPLGEAPAFVQDVARRFEIEGIYTHLPFADAAGRDWAIRAGAGFARLIAELALVGIRPSVAQWIASPGLISDMPDAGNAVAVGLLLFGLPPVDSSVGASMVGFRRALRSVVTRIVHIGKGRESADEPAPYLRNVVGAVGVIPIGMRHSFRPAHPGAFVIVDGQRASVLRVCLENTVIDLSQVRAPEVGMEVLVAGDRDRLQIDLSDLARWHGGSPTSVLAGLGNSIPRGYLGE